MPFEGLQAAFFALLSCEKAFVHFIQVYSMMFMINCLWQKDQKSF